MDARGPCSTCVGATALSMGVAVCAERGVEAMAGSAETMGEVVVVVAVGATSGAVNAGSSIALVSTGGGEGVVATGGENAGCADARKADAVVTSAVMMSAVKTGDDTRAACVTDGGTASRATGGVRVCTGGGAVVETTGGAEIRTGVGGGTSTISGALVVTVWA